MKKSLIKEKSYKFALDVIALYRLLKKQNEYVISKQLLRSATSIGSNVEEAIAAQSRADFLSKMSIASKEARETHYWLRLLRDSGTLSEMQVDRTLVDAETLIRILTAIVKTTSRSSGQNQKLKTKNLKLKTVEVP